jgi:hypothetical protein
MKKTLLIAAAALAAGIISTQAQSNVYSANVVGYANITAPVGGKNYLVSCPFAVGVSNGINEVFGSTLPANSQLLIWNGVNDYIVAFYDPSDPNGWGTNGVPVWYQADDSTPLNPLPTIPPGKGFFLVPSSPITNTFVGNVAVAAGSSNVLTLAVGGKNYLVSGQVPYAGAITNGNASGGGLNLNALPPNSTLLFWNGVNDYNICFYDPSDPNGWGTNGVPVYYKADDSTPYVDPATGGNVPTVNVGQGFFIVPSSPYSWTNGLSKQ